MSDGGVGRVLVAGAGLGGLALAQALRAAGIEAEVYEADADAGSRAQGYRIGLREYGWAALRACLPERLYRLAEATSGDLEGPGLLFDERLTVLRRDLEGPPADSRAVDRQVFRHILMGGLRERMAFGKRLQGYVEEGGAVRARFGDGTEAVGGVLVGADGGGSAVRRQLLPHIGAEESELGGVMGRTPLTERFRRLVPGRGTMIKGPGVTLMLGRMEFARPPVEAAAELAPEVSLPARKSYIRWVLMVPPDHPALREPGRGGQEVALELLEGWHPEVRELIRATDLSLGMSGRARVLDQPVGAWPPSRVTLLGDAAHLTLASGGNGANTAIEDARRLSAALVAAERGERQLLPELAAYQADLLERGNAAVAFSKEAFKRFVPVPS